LPQLWAIKYRVVFMNYNVVLPTLLEICIYVTLIPESTDRTVKLTDQFHYYYRVLRIDTCLS